MRVMLSGTIPDKIEDMPPNLPVPFELTAEDDEIDIELFYPKSGRRAMTLQLFSRGGLLYLKTHRLHDDVEKEIFLLSV